MTHFLQVFAYRKLYILKIIYLYNYICIALYFWAFIYTYLHFIFFCE